MPKNIIITMNTMNPEADFKPLVNFYEREIRRSFWDDTREWKYGNRCLVCCPTVAKIRPLSLMP